MKFYLFLAALPLFISLAAMETFPELTFTIVRHGETDWNVEKKIQGHTNTPLNETGKLQSEQLALELQDIPFAACFSSDLEQSVEMASILLAGREIPFTTDSRLRERNFGTFEGMKQADFYSLKAEKRKVESDAAIYERVKAFFNEVIQQNYNTETKSYEGGHFLVVTHGGVIRNLILRNSPSKEPVNFIEIKNGAVLKLTYSRGSWTIKDMQKIKLIPN